MADKIKTINELADEAGGKVQDIANATSVKAAEVASDVKTETADLRDKAADVAEDAKKKFDDISAKAADGAKSAASQGKDYAADAVHGLADAARNVAGKISDGTPGSNTEKVADFTRKAADSMDKFSSTLRDKKVEDLANDARKAVKANPAIAVGAAAIIGFALARFLKGGRDA